MRVKQSAGTRDEDTRSQAEDMLQGRRYSKKEFGIIKFELAKEREKAQALRE